MVAGIVCILVGIALCVFSTVFYLGIHSIFGTVLGIVITVIGFIVFVVGIVLLATTKRIKLNMFDKAMESKGFKYNKRYGDFLCDINRMIWWKRGVEIIYHIDDVVNVTIKSVLKNTVIITTTNILAPIVEIDCGKSAVTAENIKATINLLLENSKGTKRQDKVIDMANNAGYSDNIKG